MFSNTDALEHTRTRVLEHSSNTTPNTNSNTLSLVAFSSNTCSRTHEHKKSSNTVRTRVLEHAFSNTLEHSSRTQFLKPRKTLGFLVFCNLRAPKTLKNLRFSSILKPQGSGNLQRNFWFLVFWNPRAPETLENNWCCCILAPQGSGNLEKPSVFYLWRPQGSGTLTKTVGCLIFWNFRAPETWENLRFSCLKPQVSGNLEKLLMFLYFETPGLRKLRKKMTF